MAVKKTTVEKEVKKAAKPAAKAVKAPAKVAAEPKAHAPKPAKAAAEKYFYAVGRRKTSVAQVRVYPSNKAGEAEVAINDKKLKDYFPVASMQTVLTAPLKMAGADRNFKVTVLVRGGGITGQMEATRLGIARALVKFDETLKKSLKDAGFLTRDSRVVERKKPGLKGARRAPQWAKR